MKRVEVEWLDPQSVLGGWTDHSEINDDDLRPRSCRSLGYLFRDEPDLIVLVGSDGGHEVGDGLALPRGVITAMHELTPVEQRIIEAA